MLLLISFLSYAVVCVYSKAEYQTVSSNVGTIRGNKLELVIDGQTKPMFEFLGIPFAEAPVGELRFKKPVPLSNFSETFNATRYGLPCPQFIIPTMDIQHLPTPTEMSEDCLSLNIHTPNIKMKIPVMVFIYGGGFTIGRSSTYNGNILAAYGDVVVVTINYRIGPFGFLSTEDDNAVGNYGLWDQHLAIKWVKNNIESFGGDPSNITVFGESAGASSAGYQTLYSGNQGLFHRAILQSGSHRNYWALKVKGSSLNAAKQLATSMGCSQTDNGADIVSCLRQIQNITDLAMKASPIISWAPRVDEDFVTSKAVEANQWSNGGGLTNIAQDYDIIYGTNGYECHYFLYYSWKIVVDQIQTLDRPGALNAMKRFIESLLPARFDSDKLNDLLDAIMFQYSDAENPRDRNIMMKQFCDFVSDFFISVGVYKDTMMHSTKNNHTKTYQYEFDHAFPGGVVGDDWMKGASHGGELVYVFGLPDSIREFANFTDADKLSVWNTSKTVMDYWTNFAKTSNPNLPRSVPYQWKEFSTDNQDYIYFTKNLSIETKQYLNPRRNAFWTEYVPKLIQPKVTPKPPTDCTSSSSCIEVSFTIYIGLLVLINFI